MESQALRRKEAGLAIDGFANIGPVYRRRDRFQLLFRVIGQPPEIGMKTGAANRYGVFKTRRSMRSMKPEPDTNDPTGGSTREVLPVRETEVRTGFTLVELLVVIAILGVLGAVSMIAARNVAAKADHAKCLGNIKQLVGGTVLASTDLNGRFPEMEGKSGPWMQDVLWPYLNGDSPRPARVPVMGTVYTCNAAQKNAKQKWLKNGVQYRYNSFTAPGKTPLFNWSEAVVIFDKHWGDWPVSVWSHFPGAKAKVNIGYADGHVAAMPFEEYHKVCGWGGSVESYCPIYQKGWKE